MKKILIPVFLLIGLSFGAFAQEKTSKELKGDKLVFNYDYAKAIEAYQKVTQLSTDGQRKLAESYLKTGKTKEAETTYLN